MSGHEQGLDQINNKKHGVIHLIFFRASSFCSAWMASLPNQLLLPALASMVFHLSRLCPRNAHRLANFKKRQ